MSVCGGGKGNCRECEMVHVQPGGGAAATLYAYGRLTDGFLEETVAYYYY